MILELLMFSVLILVLILVLAERISNHIARFTLQRRDNE